MPCYCTHNQSNNLTNYLQIKGYPLQMKLGESRPTAFVSLFKAFSHYTSILWFQKQILASVFGVKKDPQHTQWLLLVEVKEYLNLQPEII